MIVQDAEIAGGFRAGPTSLVKLSVRKDHWTPNANPNAPKDNGYAVALQWSQFYDFMQLLTRRL